MDIYAGSDGGVYGYEDNEEGEGGIREDKGDIKDTGKEGGSNREMGKRFQKTCRED